MDIQQFSTTLRDLLLVQDKVAVPGLGLFSAGLEPASFSDRGYTVNPPYRKLVFKPESLVTESLVNAATLPVDEKELKKCVDDLKAALQSERCVELPLLGKFRLTTSGELFFVPDPELDIYPDAFGLHPVSMKNHDPQQEEQITPLDIDTPIIEPAPAPAPAGAAKVVEAPLPGVIIEVSVKEGQAVKAGQKVAVLEAMKMENEIQAECDGTVTAIHVAKGDQVVEGSKLISIA